MVHFSFNVIFTIYQLNDETDAICKKKILGVIVFQFCLYVFVNILLVFMRYLFQ